MSASSRRQWLLLLPMLQQNVVKTEVEAGPDVAVAGLGLVHRPHPPYRIWASPFNFSAAHSPELEQRFRGANLLLNSDVQAANVPRYTAAVSPSLRRRQVTVQVVRAC